MSVVIRGPKHPHHEFTVDGYKVPGVYGIPTDDGRWNVIVDGRFAITATEDEIQRWIWLLAQAQAIMAGFTCHGANSQPSNPHRVQVMQIGAVDTDGDDSDAASAARDYVDLLWPPEGD